MLELTRAEHQELTLMVGSQKEWATYLGLDTKTARSVWIEYGLKSPTQYVRALDNNELKFLHAGFRSIKALAKHLGVSESFLLKELELRYVTAVYYQDDSKLNWTIKDCKDQFERYGSVRFVARMNRRLESTIRGEITRLGLELSTLVNFSHGGHSNAKGRRAEIEFAAIRGENITRDLVKVIGPSADYDFDDKILGRVNVKSGRCFSYRSKSRADEKYYWKFSTRGREKCDNLACMFYSEDMTRLVGWCIVPVNGVPRGKSFSLKASAIQCTTSLPK